MTPAAFRRIALALPETVESSHMSHPDFRVRGKIFATLTGDERWGVVMVTPAQQAALVKNDPSTYEPAAGAWGRRGCTRVRLRTAKVGDVRTAIEDAWRSKAPKKLIAAYDG